MCFDCGCASLVCYLLGTSLSWVLAAVYMPEGTLATTVGVISALLTVLIAALYLLVNKSALQPVYILPCLFGILITVVVVPLIDTTVNTLSHIDNPKVAIVIGVLAVFFLLSAAICSALTIGLTVVGGRG